MTQDFFMGQLRLIAVGLIAYAAGRGWLSTADAGLMTQILTPLGAIAAPWIWSIYTNINSKLVPKNSVAIAPHTPGDAIAPIGANAAGKVVGALFFAFIIFGAGDVHAQSPLNARAQIRSPLAAPLAKSFLDIIKNWAAQDIDGAIALSDKIDGLKDPIGGTCWKTFKGLGDLITEHPLPVTLRLATDVEAARLLSMGLKKVCEEPACAKVWLDMQNQIAALATIAVPFSLNSICSKIL